MSARPESSPEPEPPAEPATPVPSATEGAATGFAPAVPVRRQWWAEFRPEPGEVRDLALLVIALAVAGILGGVVWPLLAPADRYEVVEGGVRALVAESEALVGADLVFVAVVTVIGIAAAVVLWLRPRWRGPLTSIGLVLGLLLCGVVTWQVGVLFRPPPTSDDLATLGQIVAGPLRLRAWVALLVPPVLSLLVYVICVVLAARDDLGHVPPRPRPTDRNGPTGSPSSSSNGTSAEASSDSSNGTSNGTSTETSTGSASSSTGPRPAH